MNRRVCDCSVFVGLADCVCCFKCVLGLIYARVGAPVAAAFTGSGLIVETKMDGSLFKALCAGVAAH